MSIVALSKGQMQCGKRVKDSKRRYHWLFKIDGTQHKLELIISFLSGKRKVVLDQSVIYQQKNLLNIKFDFRHNIGYHNLQVSQQLNQFTLRINNESFDELLGKNSQFGLQKYEPTFQKVAIKTQKNVKSNDLFSEFENIFSNSQNNPVQSQSQCLNAFEEFDMNFKYTQQSQQPSNKAQDINLINPNKENKSENILAFENNFKQFDDFNDDNMFNTNAYKPAGQIYAGNQFEPKIQKPSAFNGFINKIELGSFFEKKQSSQNTDILNMKNNNNNIFLNNNTFANNNPFTNNNINMNLNNPPAQSSNNTNLLDLL